MRSMKKLYTDWNNIKPDGTLHSFLWAGDEVPSVGEAVWATDGNEYVKAVVTGITVKLYPDWDTQTEGNMN